MGDVVLITAPWGRGDAQVACRAQEFQQLVVLAFLAYMVGFVDHDEPRAVPESRGGQRRADRRAGEAGEVIRTGVAREEPRWNVFG